MFGKTLHSIAAVALFVGASADVAPGFPIPAAQQLIISYGNNTVSPPGERIPRPETAQPPSISSPVWSSSSSSSDTALLLLVDLDVPRNGTRVQLIHWLATNITRSTTGNLTNNQLIIPSPAPAPYLQPSPPVGDVPHSYTFLLFAQPANFSVPPQYANLNSNRVPFNVTKFAADAGLGPALAGNYITVQNTSGSATASFPPARPTQTGGDGGSSGNGTGQFPGAAAGLKMGGGAVWIGLGTAMLAGVVAVAL